MWAFLAAETSPSVFLTLKSFAIIFLAISDDGKGFDLSDKRSGIGLKNMKERIEEINGIFSIESEIEKGTTIKIEIPKNGN